MEKPTTILALQTNPKLKFLRERLDSMRDAFLVNERPPTLWIGAGLSAKYGDHPTWHRFLVQFLDVNLDAGHRDRLIIEALLNSAKFDLATEMLVRLCGRDFYDAIGATFGKSYSSLPKFLQQWNLQDVITTNYDTLADACFTGHEVVLPSSGINGLLSSRPKLVKLHGSASQPDTCVASIGAYIRNYDNNLEWYLANIFQRRIVIFLGSSMNEGEPYFKDLRMLRDNGKLEAKHYCVLAVSDRAMAKAKGKRLQAYGIETIPYFPGEKYKFIDELLSYFDKAIQSPRRLNSHVRYIKSLVADGHLTLAAELIKYACMRKKVGKKTKQFLIDVSIDMTRAFNQLGAEMNKAERYKIGLDLKSVFLELGKDFVRSPRTLIGMHAAIESLKAKTNELGDFGITELQILYAEQKQLWNFEKPSPYPDKVP
jgi:SIR2-like domain